jgi:hypothetical protein
MKKPLLLIALATGSTCALAQAPVRITDPAALVTDLVLTEDKEAMAALQAAGLADGIIAAALNTTLPAAWPVGLMTDSARTANRGAIANYAAHRVCDMGSGEGATALVSLTASGNVHMPEDLRPTEDLYVVVRESGLSEPPPVVVRRNISKGPNWKRHPKARIMKPDNVYATYDLASDPAAIAALEKRGMSAAEIEAVVFRSHERNWPEAINNFESRYPKLKDFKRYKAYQAARWDGKALLIIPSEANKKVPEPIRPYLDVYMVYTAEAVQVKGRR